MVTRSMALSLTVARYPLTLLAPPNAVPIITATSDGIIMPILTVKRSMLFCRVTSGKLSRDNLLLHLFYTSYHNNMDSFFGVLHWVSKWTHPITTSYQPILSTHPISTSSLHILSIDNPYFLRLSSCLRHLIVYCLLTAVVC